jgi:glycosyltransferase involved in cell wall biosynthesis
VPDFSIITPVYNGEAFIESTVLSVLESVENSNLSYEYIVIDDGSTDGSAKILSKFQHRIRYVYQENSGQAIAINHGLTLATGIYCTIVNADDPLISAELFIKSAHLLDLDEKLVGTYPDWQIIDSESRVIEVVRVKDFSLDEIVGNFNCLIGPGGVFRTKAAQDIGGWNQKFRFVPDYDFWLRMLIHGNYAHIPSVLANWRSHDSSISISSRGLDMAKERIQVIENYLNDNPATPSEVRKSAKANSLYRAAILCFFDEKVNGRNLFTQALKAKPTLVIRRNPLVSLFLLAWPISGYFLSKIDDLKLTSSIAKHVQKKLKK